ncbi:MAG: S8 family serine peptidase [Oscillospiraceae bacterium]|jgi:hypothetical protein|nr:S8 family serine peptidase [Oscillospiraceae bacterium]
MKKGFSLKRIAALAVTLATVVWACVAMTLPALPMINAGAAPFEAEISQDAVVARVTAPGGEAQALVILAVYTNGGALAHTEAQTLETPAGVSVTHTFAADLAAYPADSHTYRVFCWDTSYRPLFDAVTPGENTEPPVVDVPLSLTIDTPFPDRTTSGLVDITYSAVPGRDAVITEVYYSIGGGASEYLYLRGDEQVNPKGVLGTGTVFLTPGENAIVFFAKDSSGQTVNCALPNLPFYDAGSTPPPFTDGDLVLGEDGVSYFVKGRLVIFAMTGVPEEDVAAAVGTVGGVIRSVNRALDMYTVEVTGDTEAALLAVADQLLDAFPALFDLVDLEYVEFVTTEAGATADPWWDTDQWGLDAIRAPGAWELSRYMREIKLGVMDNGIAYAHEDLQIPAANVHNVGAADRVHGTHVAGTVGAIHGNGVGLAGVANIRRDNLYGYDVFATASSSAAVNQADGLAWLVQRGVKVVNVSLGSASATAAGRRTLERAMQKLLDKGYDYLIVQSAGNGNSGGTPIDADNAGVFRSVADVALRQRILLVGSTDPNGALEATSNYGARVDVVAPGVSIYSTTPDNQYRRMSGSSSAAAHITGVAGLAWSVNPGLTGAQVKALLKDTAEADGRAVDDERAAVSPANRRRYYLADAYSAVYNAISTEPPARAEGSLIGRVVTASNDTPIRNASVLLFKERNFDNLARSTLTDADGNYLFEHLDIGLYSLRVSANGHLPEIIEVMVLEGQLITLHQLSAVPGGEGGTPEDGIVSGVVYNAVTGHPVTDPIHLRFTRGIDTPRTENDPETTTDSAGFFSVALAPGNYTVTGTAAGYISSTFYVVSVGGLIRDGQNGTITPILAEDQVRFVLTWGEFPSDLDSHLFGPTLSGTMRLHTWYAVRTHHDADDLAADLDVDDVTSYGPETTTVYRPRDGVYEFVVHDYTNRSDLNSLSLVNSQAKVEVYAGNALLATYLVPLNGGVGTAWYVCNVRMEAGQIIAVEPVNLIVNSTFFPSSRVEPDLPDANGQDGRGYGDDDDHAYEYAYEYEYEYDDGDEAYEVHEDLDVYEDETYEDEAHDTPDDGAAPPVLRRSAALETAVLEESAAASEPDSLPAADTTAREDDAPRKMTPAEAYPGR